MADTDLGKWCEVHAGDYISQGVILEYVAGRDAGDHLVSYFTKEGATADWFQVHHDGDKLIAVGHGN